MISFHYISVNIRLSNFKTYINKAKPKKLMQSQSKQLESYKELFDTLIALHPDLDLKLTQSRYDDELDILRTVFLKVTLKGP